MKRVLARDIGKFIGDEVLFQGWVSQLRKLGAITFLILRDRSGEVQGVLTKEEEKRIDTGKLTKESCVSIKGQVREEKQAPRGYEILIKEIEIINLAQELPFEVGRRRELLNLKLDTLLDYRPLVLRNPSIGGIFRVQREIVKGFRDFLDREDFLEVHTSKIISQATEGGSSLFPVQYFERKAFLAQSPQFYKQMLVGAGYERVYEVGFVYRAEDHETSRHLNEYVSLDLEMGFIKDENDIMDLEVRLLRFIFTRLAEKTDLLSLFNLTPEEVSPEKLREIPRITYRKAKEILGHKEGEDLTSEEERRLFQYAKEKFSSEFIFVTKFPAKTRPFYTMPDEDPNLSRSFDLLYKGIEITTGSQRIHSLDLLQENIRRRNLNPDDFKFYLQIFKYGMPPHGGLAIGLERFTCQILNLANIREASFFPRDRKRLTP